MPELGVLAIATDIDHGGRHRSRALRARLATVVTTLGDEVTPRTSTADLVQRLADLVDGTDIGRVWLTAAVLTGRLPDRQTVEALQRRARLDGLLSVLPGLLPRRRPGWPAERGAWPDVEVVTGVTLVDLHHTADTSLATGIQRVARQVSQRWARDHTLDVVVWTTRHHALVVLEGEARERALFGTPRAPGARPTTRVVPWHCTYLLPELMIEPTRAAPLEALLAFSGTRAGLIGFDCVPISSAETVGEGMASGFASMLGAAAQADGIACISGAAGGEYRGWREMLGGAGLRGPEIADISLPVEAEPADPAAIAEARDRFAVPGLPTVLVVGSHEPRKNHLAVLHVAELLWSRGVRFSLVFMGGNAWRSERFVARLGDLQAAGRPVESHSGVPDRLLWGAYRMARVTLFPSLNEGYGLPVSESLACGTPVVTSRYGSMLEIAEGGGALLVDPRDDRDIAAALERVLTDDELHAALADAARQRPRRTWDQYAEETWEFLTTARRRTGPPLETVTAGGVDR